MVFNLIGVIWVSIMFTPFQSLVGLIEQNLPGATGTFDPTVGLAVFHTTFNILNTALLIGFIGPIARLVTRLISEEQLPEPEIDRPMYLDEKLLEYPQTALNALLEEAKHLYRGPLYEVVMHGINLHRHDLQGAKSLDDLVANSRAIISLDFERFVEKHIRPIYEGMIRYSSKVHQRFTLEAEEEEQLRRIGYAARDSLLIAGKMAQYNQELNRYMDDPNPVVRDTFDEQRKYFVEFLERLRFLDLDEPTEDVERQLKDLRHWTRECERRLDAELQSITVAGTIGTTAAAGLYAGSRLLRSLYKDIIRSVRHLNAASDIYTDDETEHEEIAA